MHTFRDPEAWPSELRGGAVAIGNFDGVHRGHAAIVARLREQAKRVAGPAVVFTFDPHPVRLLRPDMAPPPLTWTDRKAELLAELGVDAMLVYPTDEALLRLTAREFFDRLIVSRLAAQAMVEGPNFYFGRDRGGTIEVLREFTREAGMSLDVAAPVVHGEQPVSSSRIRAAISSGDVDAAREMLTRPYRVRGMVTHGAGRGAKIGFPTANLGAIDTLLPGPGVYAAAAHLADAAWPAAVNVGPNPTFGDHALKVEVHLIDYEGQLYGAPLEVDFLSRLRGVQTFDGVAALTEQLQRDIAAAREVCDRLRTWSGP